MRGTIGCGGTGVDAGGIVVASAAGVREGVVGIIYLLKFLGASWAGRVIVAYTVGVVFEGCSEWGRVLAGVCLGLG